MKEYYNGPLFPFTTYKIGGNAKRITVVKTADELAEAYLKYGGYVIGGGSKLLVSDKGYDGEVIVNRAAGVRFEGGLVIAQSGTFLPALTRLCRERRLSGLEFACQIPATVGGAATMNAGAFDKSVSDVIKYVEILREGRTLRLSVEECGFGYRTSVFRKSKDLILSVAFLLETADDGLKKLNYYKTRRLVQPRGFSCGSVFKNGVEPAAKLIDRAGLKGLRCGGAVISPRHANFIINDGNASAKDVYTLIRTAKAEVYCRFGERLSEEVIYLGEF